MKDLLLKLAVLVVVGNMIYTLVTIVLMLQFVIETPRLLDIESVIYCVLGVLFPFAFGYIIYLFKNENKELKAEVNHILALEHLKHLQESSNDHKKIV